MRLNVTQKQYRKIADIIKQSNDKKELVDRLIYYFEEDNPDFDIYKFKEACCYSNIGR